MELASTGSNDLTVEVGDPVQSSTILMKRPVAASSDRGVKVEVVASHGRVNLDDYDMIFG